MRAQEVHSGMYLKGSCLDQSGGGGANAWPRLSLKNKIVFSCVGLLRGPPMIALIYVLSLATAGAFQLPQNAARATRVFRRPTVVLMNGSNQESAAPADEAAPVVESAAPPAPAPAVANDGPTLPVSSTFDKIKGLALIFVLLIVSGYVLNYAFSPNSVFLAPEEPAVNETLLKYTSALDKAQ